MWIVYKEHQTYQKSEVWKYLISKDIAFLNKQNKKDSYKNFINSHLKTSNLTYKQVYRAEMVKLVPMAKKQVVPAKEEMPKK